MKKAIVLHAILVGAVNANKIEQIIVISVLMKKIPK